MAKKETAAKKVVKKETAAKKEDVVLFEVKDKPEVNPNAELAASLENLVEKSEDLAQMYEDHAKLASKNGKHPSRYFAFANKLRSSLRLYKKDINALKSA